MSITARLCATSALATFALYQPAMADVTADDVWQNIEAYMNVFGGDTDFETSRDGDTLSVSDIAITWELPFDVGTLTATQTGFDLVENGDGTVSIQMPDQLVWGLAADINDEGNFSGALYVDQEGVTSIVSGVPGEVTYDYTADSVSFFLSDVTFDGSDTFSVEFNGSAKDLVSKTQIKVASLVTLTSDISLGEQSSAFMMTDPNGVTTSSSGGATALTANTEAAFPRSGMTILNLADAFAKGMRLTSNSQISNYATQQRTEMNGEVVSDQSSILALSDTTISIDGRNMAMASLGQGFELEFLIPEVMPFPINMEMAQVSADMTLPISASDALQDVKLARAMDGMTVPETLWGLVDPGQAIPRDPMNIRLDMVGKVKNSWNWFNFLDVAARGESGEVPGEIHAFTLNDITVEMAGASLVGNGAATFDNTDTETFGGMPKPTGQMELVLTGGNKLMDTLVSIGLLPDEQAMGARMMVGMVAKPDPSAGEDVLRSKLELTEDGQVLANGVRLR